MQYPTAGGNGMATILIIDVMAHERIYNDAPIEINL